MPAPDIETLFDLETAFTNALKSILSGSGFSTHILRGDEELTGPRLEIVFEVGPVTEHYGYMPNGETYYDTWKCSAHINVITKRRDHLQNHGREVGRVRYFLQDVKVKFTSEVLPYHSIARMVDRGSRSKVSEREEDSTEFTFEVDLSIRRDAWPST